MSHIDKETIVVVMKSKGKKVGVKILPLQDTGQSATFTLEQAELDLRNAGTLDDLKAAWSRKIMAPHRAALQAVLDERKQALSEPEQGRDDTDMGESHTDPDPAHRQLADIMLTGIRNANGDVDLIGEIMDAQRDAMKPWPADLKQEVYDAQNGALGRGA